MNVLRCEFATGYPAGRHMIDLVRERIEQGRYEEPWFLEPNYTRRSAAEEKAGGVLER